MDCSLVTRPSCSLEGSWFFQGSGWSSSSSSRRSSSSSSKYSLQLQTWGIDNHVVEGLFVRIFSILYKKLIKSQSL